MTRMRRIDADRAILVGWVESSRPTRSVNELRGGSRRLDPPYKFISFPIRENPSDPYHPFSIPPLPLLVPLALEEAVVALLVPGRRGRLPFLAEGVHRHDPVARRPGALVRERRLLDRLGRQTDDVPGALQLVDAVAGDALLG